MDSSCAYEFGNLVRGNFCTLETIVFSDNDLNNRGGKHLIESLKFNKSVQELILNTCKLSKDFEIETAINQLIFSNTTLHKIDISGNNLAYT